MAKEARARGDGIGDAELHVILIAYNLVGNGYLIYAVSLRYYGLGYLKLFAAASAALVM